MLGRHGIRLDGPIRRDGHDICMSGQESETDRACSPPNARPEIASMTSARVWMRHSGFVPEQGPLGPGGSARGRPGRYFSGILRSWPSIPSITLLRSSLHPNYYIPTLFTTSIPTPARPPEVSQLLYPRIILPSLSPRSPQRLHLPARCVTVIRPPGTGSGWWLCALRHRSYTLV